MFCTKQLVEVGRKYVIQNFETKTYFHFTDAVSMLRYYIALPEAMRIFNEVIRNGPQKMRLDIDSSDTIEDNEWKDLIERCYKALKQYTNNGKVAIFDMSDDNKRSCHMVCIDRAYDSSQTCKAIYKMIAKDIGQYVDPAVYSTVQHFRLEGSYKPGLKRCKNLTASDVSKWTMTHGLISYTDGLEIVKYKVQDHQPIQTTDMNISIISDWCKVRRVVGNRIELDRILPSYCEACHRVHESENPFIIVGYKYGFLHCRRGTTSVKVLIENKSLKL